VEDCETGLAGGSADFADGGYLVHLLLVTESARLLALR